MPGPGPTNQLDLIAGHFGKRLKHWRRHRGFTQSDLARDLDIDGSYVSKLESSHRRPGAEVARQCDELLDTGGELSQLVDLLAAGTPALAPHTSLNSMASSPPLVDRSVFPPIATAHTAVALSGLAESFALVDASMGGQHIAEAVEQQANAAISMQVGSTDSDRLLVAAARFAGLAGAIRVDSGDDAGALYWNDCARRWALDGHDVAFAAQMNARQAMIHTRHNNYSIAINLGAQVEQSGLGVAKTLWWAQLAQAYGHACAGDVDIARERLTSLETLLTDVDGALAVTCTNACLGHFHAGVCHLMLAEAGHRADSSGPLAVAHLRQALTEMSVHHTRDLALIRAHLARAHLNIDEPAVAERELAETAVLARACRSPRLTAIVDSTLAQLAR